VLDHAKKIGSERDNLVVMARDYMTTPIPVLPEDMRTVEGIPQTDIIVRTAIIAGLEDLRANPNLLDYVFASLPRDALTYRQYGEEQVSLAKEWFLSQDIPVFMNTRLDDSKLPCITIAMTGSSETEEALGDVSAPVIEEAIHQPTLVYSGPFTPTRYDAVTGYLYLPSNFDFDVFPGMSLRDGVGVIHTIEDVVDNTTIQLATGLNTDFRNSAIVNHGSIRVTVESVNFKETFEIGCHALAESAQLTYLHSIVVFILLRYKEELLESRGLERTTISSGPVTLNTSFQVSEPVFTRIINFTGFVSASWPKFIRAPVEGLTVEVTTTPDYAYGRRGIIPAAYPGIIAGGT
jgi:hypothetical protein